MKQPAMQEKLQGMGAKPIGNTPEEFAQFIAAERAKWAQVIKDANVIDRRVRRRRRRAVRRRRRIKLGRGRDEQEETGRAALATAGSA